MNLAHELAAHKNANAVLSLFAAEFTGGPNQERIRFAIEVGPVMFFEVQCSRVSSEGGFSKAREEALLNAFGPDTQADMALFNTSSALALFRMQRHLTETS
jgi:hypothetical protein